MGVGNLQLNTEISTRAADKHRPIRLISLAVFAVAFLLLFLGMDRSCNLYDEGLILTGAMRVAAGNIPYRDFYAEYGPAQFYILAGLFKLFGPSVLIERLFDLSVQAGIVTACFAWCGVYCRRVVAIGTSVICGLWLFGLRSYGAAIMPALLLTLAGSGLLLSAYTCKRSDWRFSAAGAVTGLVALFRCDVGFGLLIAHLCFIAITVINSGRARQALGYGLRNAGRYIAGTAVVFVPPALMYLAVAPIHDFIFDMITYPGKYYSRARNLPFPGLRPHPLDSLAVYLPVLVIVILLCLFLTNQYTRKSSSAPRFTSGQDVNELLTLFGPLILIFYGKGFVRVSTFHMFLAIVPSLIVIAVLLEHAGKYSVTLRSMIVFTALFSVIMSGGAALRSAREIFMRHPWTVMAELLSPPGAASIQDLTSWCGIPNPLHRGLCFLVDSDHIKAIRFIDSHTNPADQLFVGLPHHDKILDNDVLTYFAAQRMPATRWYDFNPDLQTRADIQREMISEIKSKSVPYILLDSQFDNHNEPNDSSKSSGVTLLDDFIRDSYRQVESFGELSVWAKTTSR